MPDEYVDGLEARVAQLEGENERLRWFERIARETEDKCKRLEAEMDTTQRAYDRGWAVGWAARSEAAKEDKCGDPQSHAANRVLKGVNEKLADRVAQLEGENERLRLRTAQEEPDEM